MSTETVTDTVTVSIPWQHRYLSEIAPKRVDRWSPGYAGCVRIVPGAALATDGTMLARVPVVCSDSGAWTIPTSAWEHAFARHGRNKPESVAVHFALAVPRMVWVWTVRDGKGSTLTGECVETRWPDVSSVWRDCADRAQPRSVNLDPFRLARLARALGVDPDGGSDAVGGLYILATDAKGEGPVLVVPEGPEARDAVGGSVPTLAGAIMPRTGT